MIKTENSVAICMATYNGEKYIEEQINSIISQTYTDWHLFIRDDNSKDRTKEIIHKYAYNYPKKITVIDDKNILGGSSKRNFAAIIQWVTNHFDFRYYMLSDQDDIWLNNKISKSIEELKINEEKEPVPILVHSDLLVVDQNLKVIGESFFKYRALNPKYSDLSHLLVQNNITGCTMLWNRDLNNILRLNFEEVAMHDWWIALVASCFGKICVINEPTIKYRQHGGNVVGATKVNTISFILKRLTGSAHVKETLLLSQKQASKFGKIYHEILSENQRRKVEIWSEITKYSKAKRIVLAIKNHMLKQGLVQIIGELLFL